MNGKRSQLLYVLIDIKQHEPSKENIFHADEVIGKASENIIYFLNELVNYISDVVVAL